MKDTMSIIVCPVRLIIAMVDLDIILNYWILIKNGTKTNLNIILMYNKKQNSTYR